MAGKKGMKHYPAELKERVRLEYKAGESMSALSAASNLIVFMILSR